MKYYRFTNESECHNGFQYKTGLNVDILTFNPVRECGPGGLYFFSSDQVEDFALGISKKTGPVVWVREVTFADDSRFVNVGGKWKADKFILGPRRRISLQWLCEEFTPIKIEELYMTNNAWTLCEAFAFVETLTAKQFMTCARAYNFSRSLCERIFMMHGWPKDDVAKVRDTMLGRLGTRKREQPPRACKKRKIVQ